MTDERMFARTAEFYDMHQYRCRSGDGVGGMAGGGQHLTRTGQVDAFAVNGGDSARRRVCATMQLAGPEFARHFAGRQVGYEEMLAKQAEHSPGAREHPESFHASDGLGNSMHTDHDGDRCFAGWFARKPGASSSWYFLLPRHGVAIVLRHGTWISWHGPSLPHCTAVPRVAEGDRLVSLFASLAANMLSVRDCEMRCQEVLGRRMVPGACSFGVEGLYARLEKGTEVYWRLTPTAPAGMSQSGKRKFGQKWFRWVRCRVWAMDEYAGTVDLQAVTGLRWVVEGLKRSNPLSCGTLCS
jgi:hypothetical protein